MTPNAAIFAEKVAEIAATGAILRHRPAIKAAQRAVCRGIHLKQCQTLEAAIIASLGELWGEQVRSAAKRLAGLGPELKAFCPTGPGGGIDNSCGRGGGKRDVTASPEFRAWFGNSKVVDANGKPLVVYHGTRNAGLTEFDPEKLGAYTGAESAKKAFFFSDDPEVAGTYPDGLHEVNREDAATQAGPMGIPSSLAYRLPQAEEALERAELADYEVKPAEGEDGFEVHISEVDQWGERYTYDDGYIYENKVEADDAGHEALKEIVGKAQARVDEMVAKQETERVANMTGSGILPVYLKMENPLEHDFDGGDYRDQPFSELIDEAIANGHDGVILRNVDDAALGNRTSTVYAVLSPTQIKSASGNDGKFDPNDPSITKAFCPTGPGGGVDPTCSPGGKQSTLLDVTFDVRGDALKHAGRLLAGKFKDPKELPQLIAKIAGAQPGATVRIDRDPRTEEFITVRIRHKDYEAYRDVYEDHIANENITVKEKGTGLGTRIFHGQVEAAAAAGFTYIGADCGRAEGMNGYYTWARLGYGGNLDSVVKSKLQADDLAPDWLKSATTIHGLMKLPGGLEWWQENGDSFNGTFDLSEGSLSRKVLDAYVKERAKRTESGTAAGSKSGGREDSQRGLGQPGGVRAFCPTGVGGGIDNSCAPNRGKRQTDSANFQRWFEGSKVVDGNGEPLIVFHGTTKNFNTFQTDLPEGKDWGVFDRNLGAHFAEDPSVTDAFNVGQYRWPSDFVVSEEEGRSWYREHGEIKYDGTPVLVTERDGFQTVVPYNPKVHGSTYGLRDKFGDNTQLRILPPGGQGKAVYLAIKNPLRVEPIGRESDQAAIPRVVGGKVFAANRDLFVDAMTHNGMKDTVAKEMWETISAGKVYNGGEYMRFGSFEEIAGNWHAGLNDADLSRRAKATLEELGYDGIVYKNTSQNEVHGNANPQAWIAFHPEQVKSATGNSGAFDPENPDSTKAVHPMPIVNSAPSLARRIFNPREWDQELVDRLLPLLAKGMVEASKAQLKVMGRELETTKGWVLPGRKAFCPTGVGGGVDPTCSPHTDGGGSSPPGVVEMSLSAFTYRDENDEFLYHISPVAAKIVETGVLRTGKQSMDQGFYRQYSKGKVFFTERSRVKWWADRIEQHLEAQHDDPPALSVVRIPRELLAGKLKDDEVGNKDDLTGRGGSYYIEGEVRLTKGFQSTKATTATEWLSEQDALTDIAFDTPLGDVSIRLGTEYPDWMKKEIQARLSETFSQPYWKKVNETTQGDIEKYLREGLENGWSIERMAHEMAGDLDEDGRYAIRRGRMIARTEGGHVLNAGRSAAMDGMLRETGITAKKTWMSVLGNTTRADHANIDGVPCDENGLWYLGGYPARWPGDVTLPAGQRINCQCTINLEYGMQDDEADELRAEYELRAAAQEAADNEKAFCPTGPGGGVDPTCSPHSDGGGGRGRKLEPSGIEYLDGRTGRVALHRNPTKNEMKEILASVVKKDPGAEAQTQEEYDALGDYVNAGLRGLTDVHGNLWVWDATELTHFDVADAGILGKTNDDLFWAMTPSQVDAVWAKVQKTRRASKAFCPTGTGGGIDNSCGPVRQLSTFLATKRDAKGKLVLANGDPLPKHIAKMKIPPAWVNVQIASDPKADLQVRGEDSKGRTIRLYHETHATRQAAKKFAKVNELRKKADEIKKEIQKDIGSKDHATKENAACLYVIQQTGIRPGSDTDTKAAKQAYGATTLEGRHVVNLKKATHLRFTGKKGVDLDIAVKDAQASRILLERKAAAGPKGRLFDTTDEALREYSQTKDGGGFNPKDFRTARGTSLAVEAMKGMAEPKDAKEYKKAVKAVATVVAKELGNTPTIALQSYISPEVFAKWRPSEMKAPAKKKGLPLLWNHEDDKAFCPTGVGGGVDNSCPPNVGAYLRGERRDGDDHMKSKAQKKWESAILEEHRRIQIRNRTSRYEVLSDKDLMLEWTHAYTEGSNQRAMEKLMASGPKFKGTVWRGVDAMPKMKEGQVIKVKKLAPTSRDPKVARDFLGFSMEGALRSEGLAGASETGTLMKIKLKSGLAVERFSEFRGEREVVMPKGRYKVERVLKSKKLQIVELRQL